MWLQLCKNCGKGPYRPGTDPDPCLGLIEEVLAACCGHGDDFGRYVLTSTNEIFRGKDADLVIGSPLFQREQCQSPKWTEEAKFGMFRRLNDDSDIDEEKAFLLDCIKTYPEIKNWKSSDLIDVFLTEHGGKKYLLAKASVLMTKKQKNEFVDGFIKAQGHRRSIGNQDDAYLYDLITQF